MSTSEKIVEALRAMAPDAEFTSRLLASQLGCTEGAVTGMISRLKTAGAVKVVGREGRQWIYSPADVSVATYRTSTTPGGQAGRKMHGQTSSQKLAELLRSIAEDVEKRPSGLADFTDADLIRELGRRERARNS